MPAATIAARARPFFPLEALNVKTVTPLIFAIPVAFSSEAL